MIYLKEIHFFYSKRGKENFQLHLRHMKNKASCMAKIRKKDFLELIHNNEHEVYLIDNTKIFVFK